MTIDQLTPEQRAAAGPFLDDMVAILMTQRLLSPEPSGVYLDFWTSVYQAIDN